MDSARVILPQTVKPSRYHVTLEPDLVGHTFVGTEVIDIQVLSDGVNEIVLNSIDIEVQKAYVRIGDKRIEPTHDTYDKERETISFSFADAFAKCTEATLHLEFTGILNDKMKGFYRSKYKNAAGEDAYMGVTQFEATDARRAFPCWDEPNLKATFIVSLIVPSGLLALSNMPESNVEEGYREGMKRVTFQETPNMSTYIVAFVVGEFDVVEETASNGVHVRVFTPVGKKEQGKFALQVAAKTLPFYDEYFGTPYPLPKSDLIAIPDFAAGAMENWGLVTYRETCLLVDPSSTSAQNKQYVALVVGHELAHMWFGNLVTMDWWTHLWLNEGFASWIEYLCVDFCFPEFEIWTQFVYNDMNRALELDALKSTHPVEVEVRDPAEIDEIFDLISYCKGSSIVRMLANWLGTDAYKRGLSLYLSRHKYANAVTEDLWAALAEASGKALMDTWTKQSGHPVLSIDACPDRPGYFRLSQTRFLSSGEKEKSTLWWVPLQVQVGGGAGKGRVRTCIMKEPELELELAEAAEPSAWLKVNPRQTGFYRVAYSAELLARLRAPVSAKVLPPPDRLGIQSDAFALARAGHLSAADVFGLLQAYRSEDDYTVIADVAANLSDVQSLLVPQDEDAWPGMAETFDRFLAFGQGVFGATLERVGWKPLEGEAHLQGMLRSLVIRKMALLGSRKVGAKALITLKEFASSLSAAVLPADLRGAVYIAALSTCPTEEAFDLVMSIFDRSDLQEEQDRCLRSLGYACDGKLLRRTLEFSLTEKVRSQDTVFVIQSVANNPLGRVMTWEFVKEHWAELHERYEGGFLLSRLAKCAVHNFTTEARAAEAEAFFREHKAAAAERAVAQAVEKVRSNQKWLNRDREAIRAWLEANA